MKIIAFDLFGVVISEGHMVSNALMPLLPFGTDRHLVKRHYQDYTLGKTREAEFWQGIGQSNYEMLRQNFLDSFVLDPDFRSVANAFKSRYQLAILSNLAKDWGEFLIEKFNFNDDFSPIIISGDVCCGKPDPAIYQTLIAQSGSTGEEIAFIDDRLENLAAAHQFGMTTIHYKREADQHAYVADHVITDMTALRAVFSE